MNPCIQLMRDGSYCPIKFELGRRSKKVLLSLVQRAYLESMSTSRLYQLQLLAADKPKKLSLTA